MKIGIIGLGILGGQHLRFFREYTKHEVLTYDTDPAKKPNSTFDSLAVHADIIFLCLPTPGGNNGRLDTIILEETISRIAAITKNCAVVIRSTVPIGFTRSMQLKHGNIAVFFIPEFLTERFAWEDFMHPLRYIVGVVPRADEKKNEETFKAGLEIAHILPKPFDPEEDPLEHVMRHITGQATEARPPKIWIAEQAEAFKLFTNSFYALKVIAANELAEIAAMGQLNYDEMREELAFDPRIGSADWDNSGRDVHLRVAQDGQRGFGGKCLPKDLNELRAFRQSLGINSRGIFDEAAEINMKLRRGAKQPQGQIKGRKNKPIENKK